MPDHIKPTVEELEANLQKTQAELDALHETPEPETPKEEVAPEAEAKLEEETIIKEPAKEEEVTPEAKKEAAAEEEEEPAPSPDYKEKFTHSTREAQILAAREKKMSEAIAQAEALPIPDDEELAKEAAGRGFSIDEMSVVEKALFKDSVVAQRKLSLIGEVDKERKNIEAWNEKVDVFIDDPKTLIANPELEGKAEAFKVFSGKPTRRGVDFETLVSSFLYTVEQEKAKKPKNTGAMFEIGSGGPPEKEKQKSDILTIQQGSILRETNYKKWREMLIAGKIANE